LAAAGVGRLSTGVGISMGWRDRGGGERGGKGRKAGVFGWFCGIARVLGEGVVWVCDVIAKKRIEGC
jgi:hypothetical protein